MDLITIVTATYNREKLLLRLYESLELQTEKEFCWIIVDDGSNDNTESCVHEWEKQASFHIRYVKKENGGKHTALNIGMQFVETPLTFFVDSDDYLSANAISLIKKTHQFYKKRQGLCGYSFLRAYSDGKIMGPKFPQSNLIGDYITVRINGKIGGDKAEVFYTKCLKEYPFPEYEGEKFLGEDVVWMKMAKKYQMVHNNDVICIGDYLEDGLSKNRRLHNIRSAKGCVERSKLFMDRKIYCLGRIKGAIQYIIYSKYAGRKCSEILNNTEYKELTCLCFPLAMIIYHFWKIKYKVASN